MAALQAAEATPEEAKRGATRWRRLETVAQCRVAMAVMIRRVYDGKLDPERARVAIGGLRHLAAELRACGVEERIAEIERRLQQ